MDDFMIQHWLAYVVEHIAPIDDPVAENVYNEGLRIIEADPELWAERGWAKLWDYIAALPC